MFTETQSCVSVLLDIEAIVRNAYESNGMTDEDEERILDLIESVWAIDPINEIKEEFRKEQEDEDTYPF